MNNIKILRVGKNMSQDELAKQVHVTQTAVSQWEKGKTNPDIQTADKLALFFDVSVDYLLGRIDERSNAYYASNIRDSHFVQGNGFVATVNDMKISKEEAEILRVYRLLGVRERAKLMSAIFEFEDGIKQNKEEKAVIPQEGQAE
ncbi:MAG: helix-turn-helix domain-containing protein [Clostridiales Family XIII bacterium]|jgi:transcriptional regulator with XRE-family HTH domain|nr:helix-turn-helix domain-containing protein [Clostridiales Family XIII bacterium]